MSKYSHHPRKIPASALGALLAALLVAPDRAPAITAFTPANQPIGYVAQDEVTNFDLTSGSETLFRDEYKRDYWGGNLFAYPVDATGNVRTGEDRWTNGIKDHVDAQNWDTGRLIATMSDATTPGTGVGVAFRLASLTAAQQASLAATINGTSYTNTQILSFLRGDRTNEGTSALRQRSTVVGDIVHSRPYFVNDDTNPTIFIGSNDGMLHAINATNTAPAPSTAAICSTTTPTVTTTTCSGTTTTTGTPVTSCTKPLAACANCGTERWAYIPSMLISKLKTLAYSPYDAALPYSHDYFVDGQISIATLSNGTTRLLVGGLGAGGKGLYALNISTLTAASEADVASKVLWEITPTTVNYATPRAHTSAAATAASASAYSHLGYTYGTPLITKINYGGTAMDVVIIGNGYDSTANGESYLYVINATTGALVRAIQAGTIGAANPNGLSSPAALDTNNDGYADRVYAGDLNGTMWKFDLSSTDPTLWSATALLVTSPAQSITSTPGVALHPNGGYMVSFGTGKVFTGAYGTYNHTTGTWTTASTGDLGDTSTYYVYGVWDGAPAGNAGVLTQTLTERTYTTNIISTTCNGSVSTQVSTPFTARVRRSTANTPNWASGGTKYWKVALPAGERVTGEGSFTENGRFYFIGFNPTVAPYQVPGTTTDLYGENWLMELNYLTGGSSTTPFLDMNSDLLLNDSDRIDYIASDTIPAGKVVGDRILTPNENGVPVGKWLSTGVQSQPILVQLQTLNTTLFNANPDVIFPPTTAVSRGVAGGHFDVDNFYGTSNNCSNVSGVGSPATGGRIDFTYSGNKTVSNFSITINGTNILTANNPGSQSRSGLESWVLTNSNSADYNITVSSGRINLSAKANGSAFNATTANIVVSGTGITSSDYTKQALTGGVDNTLPISTTSSTSCQYVHHEHEYDDKYDKTGVNFLNASQPAFNLSNAIPSTSTNFKVLMMNQYLSPAVSLHIGNPAYNPTSSAGYISVKNYQTAATLDLTTVPTYNRSTIGSLALNMPVDAFTVKDWWGGTGDLRVGLHSVSPQCAWSGSGLYADMYQPVMPPPNGTDGPGTVDNTGARHNGTLTIQIIKDTTPNSAIEQNVAGRPEYGYRVKHANFFDYVLAEYIIYWHHPRNQCYSSSGTAWKQTNNNGDAWNTVALMTGSGWTKAPPEDNAVSTANSTPATGSTDPKLGTLGSTGTVATVTTTVTGNVTTVTTTYTDGSRQVVTQTANANGTVTIVTTLYDSTGTATSSTTEVVADSRGSVKTGGDERGQQARTGRVSWHELIRQ